MEIFNAYLLGWASRRTFQILPDLTSRYTELCTSRQILGDGQETFLFLLPNSHTDLDAQTY